jgi:hypothetical protein
MIYAIVTSLDRDHLSASPNEEVDLESLVGKRVQYVDKSEKVWPGVVASVEDPFVIVKFDQFPSGLGQGQMLEILDKET